MRAIHGEYGWMTEADAERFWETGRVFVTQVGHWRCWEWCARRDHRGYGRFWLNGQYRPAHRILWIYLNPRSRRLRRAALDIPESTPQLDHRCNNRACLRHTQPVSAKKNNQLRADRYWLNRSRRRARLIRALYLIGSEEIF